MSGTRADGIGSDGTGEDGTGVDALRADGPRAAGRGLSRPRAHGQSWVSTLTEGVGIALDVLATEWVRSGLTILGVAIGVAVVMVMAAVIQGVNDSFTEILSAQGPKTFWVQHAALPGGPQTGLEEEEPEFLTNPPLDPAWADRIRDLPEIREVSPIANLTDFDSYTARHGAGEARVSVYAVGPEYLEIDNGDLTDGRFFTRAEYRRGRPLAVVDSSVAVDVFRGGDPLGRDMELAATAEAGGRPFRVVGSYQPPANLFSGLATHYVFVPFSAALRYLDFWDRAVAFVVHPEPEVPLADALDAVRGRMRQLRGLAPGEEENFALVTQDQVLDLWNQLTAVLFSVMVALSSVGLMVGGIGVVGIMMISVTERTREIGVRKALGARRRDVLWQFLVESATVTVLGGIVGMAVGGGIASALRAWTPVPASVPLWAVAAALLVSALTGIGFGLYPATRGARLDPVDALRHE